jgi:hypothetical protein
MSLNININNINYTCAPMIKEGFQGNEENIGWMCSSGNKISEVKKSPAEFVPIDTTCQVIKGSVGKKSNEGCNAKCTWTNVNKEDCNQNDGQMNGSVCEGPTPLKCPHGFTYVGYPSFNCVKCKEGHIYPGVGNNCVPLK